MIARPLAPRAPIPFASPDRAVSTPSLTTRMAPAASGLPRRSPVQVPQAPEPSMHDGATVTARFTGQGRLSVRSSVSGRHYRFSGHGDTQAVDTRDVMMLRRMPDLHVG